MKISLKKDKWSPIFSSEFNLENGNIDNELKSIRNNIEDLRSVQRLDDTAVLNKY